jgi:hypothetical protein
MAAQLYQELQAGEPASSDLYIATAVQISPYIDKGLFRTVDWVSLMPSRITPAMVEADGKAIRVATNLPGIVYNMQVAPWVKDVNTTTDLLKPDYKGKFYTTPFLGGFDVLLAPEVWGVARTTDYVKKFAQQIAGLVGCEATTRIRASPRARSRPSPSIAAAAFRTASTIAARTSSLIRRSATWRSAATTISQSSATRRTPTRRCCSSFTS